MNTGASFENGRDVVRMVKARSESIGRRPMGKERGGRMPLAWWTGGAALFAVLAWAIANTLLRWLTVD